VYGSDEVDEEQAGTRRALTRSWQDELLLQASAASLKPPPSTAPTPLSSLI
jgi:hypothetical protein